MAKFLGLTAALAVGAGVGVGAYYGVRAVGSRADAPEPEAPAAGPEQVDRGERLVGLYVRR